MDYSVATGAQRPMIFEHLYLAYIIVIMYERIVEWANVNDYSSRNFHQTILESFLYNMNLLSEYDRVLKITILSILLHFSLEHLFYLLQTISW